MDSHGRSSCAATANDGATSHRLGVVRAKRLAALFAAKVRAFPAGCAAIAPGKDRVIHDEPVKSWRYNFQRGALVPNVDPNRNGKNENHDNGLEAVLDNGGGDPMVDIHDHGAKRRPGFHVP